MKVITDRDAAIVTRGMRYRKRNGRRSRCSLFGTFRFLHADTAGDGTCWGIPLCTFGSVGGVGSLCRIGFVCSRGSLGGIGFRELDLVFVCTGQFPI